MTPQIVVMAKLTPKMYLSPYRLPLKMRRVKEMTEILARQRAMRSRMREMKKYYRGMSVAFMARQTEGLVLVLRPAIGNLQGRM